MEPLKLPTKPDDFRFPGPNDQFLLDQINRLRHIADIHETTLQLVSRAIAEHEKQMRHVIESIKGLIERA